MKITFILYNPNLCGGVRVVATYADLLQQRGHQVLVVSVPLPKPSPVERLKAFLKNILKREVIPRYVRFEESHLDYVDVPHVRLNHNPPIQNTDLPDADVVIATWWETAEWVNQLSDSKGVKVHFVQHHEVFDYLPIERVKATYFLPLYKITPAAWLADVMREQYQAKAVTLVPNSVNTRLFYAPPRQKQPQPTIGIVYSTIAWKDCKTGLAAFRLASLEIPNLRLVAFGQEEISPEIPLPANSTYRQKPDQETIRTLYASCDVWIFSSILEGFGLPVLEAMACRSPVISTMCSGPQEIVDHGINGFLAPVGDVAALANYIVKVAHQSNDEWLQLSQAAYAKATSYTWDDAAAKFETALLEAVSSHRQLNRELKPAQH